MSQHRFPLFISAILSAVLLLSLAVPAYASNGTGALPVSFILDSALDAHEQDIKENIFEYKFNAANNDPTLQSELVQKRSEDLKKVTMNKKSFMQALIDNGGTIPDGQMEMLAEEMGKSFQKLDAWSKKLEEHAAGLTLLKGHKTYTDDIQPLMKDINDAKGLAMKAARDASDKKGSA
jgi:hypothetical protein